VSDLTPESGVAICTIASANYLAYAKTLSDSVRQFHPDVAFFLLVVDRPTPEIDEAILSCGLQAIYAEELGISDFERLALKFDVVELNTALKPTMLKLLFAKGFDKVLYLDPDIKLFSRITPVLGALDDNNIVFTPHTVKPVMDGHRPSDIDFLRAGSFNLGFVGLRASQQTSSMLNWWEERCLAFGFIDTAFGIFVDQKWMDLVPCYFDGVYVLKHLGCNVAYWNLHERQVSDDEGSYTVNGHPLCFFHFSGVKFDRPGILSKYQDRHNLSPNTAIAALVADYCRDLNSNGHSGYSNLEYSFGSFDNGINISRIARRSACFGTTPDHSPFSSTSEFYKFARKSGFLSPANSSKVSVTSSNFNESSLSVRLVNVAIRIVSRAVGADRLSALVRYIAILDREDNLARVLSKTPFNFAHSKYKSRSV
jgi:hypothetical protein